MDGSQAMRDPVGGSVEFHFVPILKLISTLLIMGIFNNDDVRHILKMIDPNVFGDAKEEKAEGEGEEEGAAKEEGEETKEEEEAAEGELVDEGVGEEEEDEELKALKKEEGEEGGETEKAEEEQGVEKADGEKAEEEKEAEEGGEEVQEGVEEAPEEGLLQMKLPESVKLQVRDAFIFHLPLALNKVWFTPVVVHQLSLASLQAQFKICCVCHFIPSKEKKVQTQHQVLHNGRYTQYVILYLNK